MAERSSMAAWRKGPPQLLCQGRTATRAGPSRGREERGGSASGRVEEEMNGAPPGKGAGSHDEDDSNVPAELPLVRCRRVTSEGSPLAGLGGSVNQQPALIVSHPHRSV